MHDKTKFAKPPQEGYLGIGQIPSTRKNKKMAKIEKSGKGMVLKKLITEVNMIVNRLNVVYTKKISMEFFRIVPRMVRIVVSAKCIYIFILSFNNL